PVAIGANRTVTAQLLPLLKLAGQLLVWEKSPLAAIAILLMLLPLLFATVTVCGLLVVPTSCLLKMTEPGERVRGGNMPVPVKLTVWGLVDAVSSIVSVPVRAPIAVGTNVTLMLHDFPPA